MHSVCDINRVGFGCDGYLPQEAATLYHADKRSGSDRRPRKESLGVGRKLFSSPQRHGRPSLEFSERLFSHSVTCVSLALPAIPHSMRNEVYVSVVRLSVRLSVPTVDRCSSVRRVCCCGPGGREISIDCCTSGAQQQPRR